MNTPTRIDSMANRWLRWATLVASLVVAASCNDQAPVAPRKLAPGHARLAVRPVYQAGAPGGPSLTATKAVGVLLDANGDTVQVVTVKFDGDSATLSFDAPIVGPSSQFTLDLTDFDANGVSIFHGTQSYVLKPGDNDVPPPVLIYSAPDAKLATIHVSPTSMLLQAGGTSAFGVSGTAADGRSISPINVGWTTKDASVATIDAGGNLTAGKFQGSTFVIARTFSGLADSAVVTVHAPVDHVVAAPAALQVIRGKTGAVTAELRDAGNHLIDDRSAVWTSADPSIATVSSTGVVQGVKVGATTLTASAEGKSASVAVTVVSPIDHIDITPASLTFASLGEKQAVSAHIVPRAGATADETSISFTSSNASVASVDGQGNVTATGNGSATITATADGVTATASATVRQAVASISVAPKTALTTSLGESRTFGATALDANGNAISGLAFTWTSSNPHVATVGSNGTATAQAPGTASITASAEGKSDAGTLIATQVPKAIAGTINVGRLEIGQTATVSAIMYDAQGNVMGTTVGSWSTSTPTLVSINGNQVTGIGAGIAQLTVTAAGLTAHLAVQVDAGTLLTITPDSVEKLPNGTQQFTPMGGPGPFTWTVHGVAGGNATFGTITSDGLYTAPATVPSPSSFLVCATEAVAPTQGCARVTITAVPSSGADIVVFNDMNLFDDENGVATGGANQLQFFRNLATFTATGPRASKTGFEFFRGHQSLCAEDGECLSFSMTQMTSTLASAGFTIVNVDDPNATIPSTVDPSIKVILLLNPTVPFSVAEINSLKAFAGQGGRIIFAGEHGGFYGSFIGPVENTFFSAMGAQLTNSSTIVNCQFGNWVVPQSSLRSHQVTTGLTGLSIPCASSITPGPNDFPIVYDVTGQFVVGAVAKIDLTPLSTTSVRAQRTKSRTNALPNSSAAPLPPVDGVNKPRKSSP